MTVREDLAAYAHASWSNWTQYMFFKCKYAADGSLIIPEELVRRWARQMNTVYKDLPENEKASDRTEADNIQEIFRLASENEVLHEKDEVKTATSSRKPNSLLPHSTTLLRFEVIAEVEASEFFDSNEGESVNWHYCNERATFSHKHACEFILHCGEAEFTKRKVDEMKAFGCTTAFIDTYISAAASGAVRVLFYV